MPAALLPMPVGVALLDAPLLQARWLQHKPAEFCNELRAVDIIYQQRIMQAAYVAINPAKTSAKHLKR
jgi:hypothetical protein